MKLRAWFSILMMVLFIGTGFGKDTPDLTKNSTANITQVTDNVGKTVSLTQATVEVANCQVVILEKTLEAAYFDTSPKRKAMTYISKDTTKNYSFISANYITGSQRFISWNNKQKKIPIRE